MHGVSGYPFYAISILKVWLLIKFWINFKVAFNQVFFTSSGNMLTSAKFLGSEMKCDTSDPDSPKVGNELFNLFTTALNILSKTFPILFAESSSPLH